MELANAMLEYLEIFHNRQRRHSALGMLTPIEFENVHFTHQPVACNQIARLHETLGTSKSPETPGCFYICQDTKIGCAGASVRNSCRVT
ncbi:IS3 family transposase [Rhodococcus erythropolis]|uniref:IS3 family transposase n=1 Tax=Rhodococcus erythropolis TaxID=1833 RepID=UPI0037F87CD5